MIFFHILSFHFLLPFSLPILSYHFSSNFSSQIRPSLFILSSHLLSAVSATLSSRSFFYIFILSFSDFPPTIISRFFMFRLLLPPPSFSSHCHTHMCNVTQLVPITRIPISSHCNYSQEFMKCILSQCPL